MDSADLAQAALAGCMGDQLFSARCHAETARSIASVVSADGLAYLCCPVPLNRLFSKGTEQCMIRVFV